MMRLLSSCFTGDRAGRAVAAAASAAELLPGDCEDLDPCFGELRGGRKLDFLSGRTSTSDIQSSRGPRQRRPGRLLNVRGGGAAGEEVKFPTAAKLAKAGIE